MSGHTVCADKLTKVYHTTVPRPGQTGRLRSLLFPVREAKVAVYDVTFSAMPGEIVTILGPNGVGESTTIKMLTGILTPTARRLIEHLPVTDIRFDEPQLEDVLRDVFSDSWLPDLDETSDDAT